MMEHSLSNYELSDTLKTEDSSNNESDDFDNNLPSTVNLMRHPETGAKVYLVGTAHFSQESKDDVALVIRNVQPHIVILELCDARVDIILLDEKAIFDAAKNISFDNILSTIKKNGFYYGISYMLLLNLSAHYTKEIGMAPGGEFRVAVQEAANIPKCIVQLGDRPIKITCMRALSKLSWWQTIKLGWQLLFTKETITKEDVEQCKRRDMLEQLIAEMSDEYPSLSEVFLDERDIFLTYSLQQAAKVDVTKISDSDDTLRVVGVVGIGHALGINRLFPVDQGPHIRNILTIPPKTLTSKILILTFKLSTLGLFGLLVYKYMRVPKFIVNSCHGVWDKVSINLRKF